MSNFFVTPYNSDSHSNTQSGINEDTSKGVISTDLAIIQAFLKSRANIDIYDNTGFTALQSAKDSMTIQSLLKNGVNINTRDNDGQTALHIAKDPAIVHLFIKNRADINARDNDSQTPLHSAVHQNNLKKVKALLEAGADIHAKTIWGHTALHLAKCPAIVQILLENGADVNAKNNYGDTALYSTRNPTIVQMLLENGADVIGQDKPVIPSIFSTNKILIYIFHSSNQFEAAFDEMSYAGAQSGVESD